MHYAALISPVILPVLFWAWYHYYKDRHLPEPVSHLLAAFLLGGVAFLLGKFMYAGLDLLGLRYDAFLLAESDRFGLLLYAVLAIGPIEELAKLLPFLLVIRFFPKFDEPLDGIIYASFIALGFAAIENIQYLQYLTSGEAIARGFAGPVVHIVFASIWGFYIGRASLNNERVFLTITLALGGTAVLHGLYDYLVIALPTFALPASALLVIGIWLWRIVLIRDLHAAARGAGALTTGKT
jgi:RsiW-degrading membrane proteinase PrsW (M82 family)